MKKFQKQYSQSTRTQTHYHREKEVLLPLIQMQVIYFI